MGENISEIPSYEELKQYIIRLNKAMKHLNETRPHGWNDVCQGLHYAKQLFADIFGFAVLAKLQEDI